MYFDRITGDNYNEVFDFDFKCELLDIVNDKIRLHYWIPINDQNYTATYFNDLKSETIEPLYNKSTVFFQRITGFIAQIKCEYHPDLNDLKSWFALFHTKIGKNLTAYNNWNFSSDTSSKWWDSIEHGFWFAESTTMLIQTVPYIIGKQQIMNAYIQIQPERTFFKKQLVTDSIFGIPYKFADRIIWELIWKQTIVRNDDFFTPIRFQLPDEQINGTDIISNIDFEFTERIYNIYYFDAMDILSQLGGLRASLMPIMGIFIPFFTIHFLHQLAIIIQNDIKHKYHQSECNLIETTTKQLRLIQIAYQSNQIQIDPALEKSINRYLSPKT